MSGPMGILETKGKGRRVVMIKVMAEAIKSLDVGHVAWLGIGQRIQHAKQNQGSYMKVHQSEHDWALNPIKITASREQQSQFANSIKI
jgi:hypothetical protein